MSKSTENHFNVRSFQQTIEIFSIYFCYYCWCRRQISLSLAFVTFFLSWKLTIKTLSRQTKNNKSECVYQNQIIKNGLCVVYGMAIKLKKKYIKTMRNRTDVDWKHKKPLRRTDENKYFYTFTQHDVSL